MRNDRVVGGGPFGERDSAGLWILLACVPSGCRLRIVKGFSERRVHQVSEPTARRINNSPVRKDVAFVLASPKATPLNALHQDLLFYWHF